MKLRAFAYYFFCLTFLLGALNAGMIVQSGRFAAGGGPSSITSSGDWSGFNTTSTVTATARTITVPGGSDGKVKLNCTASSCTQQYSINGGAFTTFTSGTIITMTNGQTLNFRITTSGSGSQSTGTVDDNTTAVNVGHVDIENTTP